MALTPGNTSSGASATQAHTVASGSNILMATVVVTTTLTTTLTATYGGVAMTIVPSSYQESGTRRTADFFLLNPTSGAANIVFSSTETILLVLGSAIDYSGANVDTGLQFDYIATQTGTATSDTVSPNTNTVYDNDTVYAVSVISTANNQTTSNSQTEVSDQTATSLGMAVGYKTATGDTTTIGWSFSSSTFTLRAYAIRPIGIYSKQPTETDAVDTFLDSGSPTTNYATNGAIYVGESNGSATVYRTLIKFLLNSLPSGASATNASLLVTTASDSSDNARDYKIYRMIQSWTEAGVTWNRYDGTNNWPGGAGAFTATDCDTANIWATTNFGASIANGTQKTFTLSTVELNKMINGTYTNNGWMIKADTENNDNYGLASASDGVVAKRPKLVVQYTNTGASGGFLVFF